MNLGMGLYLSQRSGLFTGFVGRHCALVSGGSGHHDRHGRKPVERPDRHCASHPEYRSESARHNATDAGYNGQATVQSTATNMFLVSGAAAATQPCSVLVVGQITPPAGSSHR